jgi:small-conductance mechanosensitive channel
MIHARLVLTFLVVLVTCSCADAQVRDSSVVARDSINTSKLQQYQQRIEEIEKQRLADSIKRAELELRIRMLSAADQSQKEELQRQLQSLSENEGGRIAQKKAQIDSMRATVKGFPVEGFFGDTLFMVYSSLGSFSAATRAEAIQQRIRNVGKKIQFASDTLSIVTTEFTMDLLFKDDVIMSISEADALWNNTTRAELAEKYKQIITDAIKRHKSETSLAELAKEIGLALLVLLVIGVIIFYIGKLFKWIAKKIAQQENKRVKGIMVKNYMLFDASKQISILIGISNIFKWAFILLAIYITLPILFGIFPWTENFAGLLLGYILSPIKRIALSIWHYLPNLITIIIIILLFRVVIKVLRFLRDEIAKGHLQLTGFYADWARPTYQIIWVLVFAFMLVVIFPYLPGSDSPIFRGVSVFLGFLFTFGSAGSLSNIIAGLVLTYMRLFKIGDRVKVGDVLGDVIERSILVTRIRTNKNEIISIPNSTVMSSHTINYNSDAPERGLIIHTTVTIGYDVPWRKMHQALIDAAMKTEHVQPEPSPFVLQTGLEDFYVSYQVNAYTKEPNKQATIYSELHQNIQDVCNERGIEIMSPHYRAARDGSTTTIPADYLDKNYQAPGFNIHVHKTGDEQQGK